MEMGARLLGAVKQDTKGLVGGWEELSQSSLSYFLCVSSLISSAKHPRVTLENKSSSSLGEL